MSPAWGAGNLAGNPQMLISSAGPTLYWGTTLQSVCLPWGLATQDVWAPGYHWVKNADPSPGLACWGYPFLIPEPEKRKNFRWDLYNSRKTSSGLLHSGCLGSVTGGAKLKWSEDLQHGHRQCLLFLATFCWTPLLVTGWKEETSSFLVSPGSSLRNKAVPHFTKNKMQQ